MGRVIITGDTHSDISRLFNLLNKGLTKEDIVIVLGDFGVIWNDKEATIKYLKKLEDLDFTLAFLDGNHENFNLISELESISYWNNGYAGILPGGVIHLLRGEIYEISNRRIGVCGGANSVDLWHRKENESWWKQEDITQDDVDTFKANLEKGYVRDGEIDIMLSHTCPAGILPQVALYSTANGKQVPVRNCEEKLEQINKMAKIDKWYFGHWHIDRPIDNKFECLYKGIKEV